jgi:hypothetical protein
VIVTNDKKRKPIHRLPVSTHFLFVVTTLTGFNHFDELILDRVNIACCGRFGQFIRLIIKMIFASSCFSKNSGLRRGGF